MLDFTCGQSYPSGEFVHNLPPIDVQIMYDGIPVDTTVIPIIKSGTLCGKDPFNVIFPGCHTGTPISQIFVSVVSNQGVYFPDIELTKYYSDVNTTIYLSDSFTNNIPISYYLPSSSYPELNQTINVGYPCYLEINTIYGGTTVYNPMNPKSFDFRIIGMICAAEPERMNLFYNRFNFKLAGGEDTDLSDVKAFGAIQFICTSSGTISRLGSRDYNTTFPIYNQYCSPLLSVSGINVL